MCLLRVYIYDLNLILKFYLTTTVYNVYNGTTLL